MYKLNASQHADPSTANSILADLPITKARNSYSSVGTQGVELLDGEDGSLRFHHRFCFRFFKISNEHVNKINTIMLDNAQECQTIAFTLKSALRMTIEHYLTLPADQGFKVIINQANDHKRLYLSKLEYILKQLGSDKRLVYQLQSDKLTKAKILEVVGDKLMKYLPEQPTEFMQLYMKLGELPSDGQRTFLTKCSQAEARQQFPMTWIKHVEWSI